MEFMAGVYDLYAYTAITKRWVFWLMAVSIPLGFVSAVVEIARYAAS
jgi:hypothetical protein